MLEVKNKLTKDDQIKLYFDEIAPRLGEGMTQNAISKELNYSKHQISRAIKSASLVNGELIKQGVDPDDLHSAWIKVDGYSMYVQNKEGDKLLAMQQLLEDVRKYAPKYTKIKRKKQDDPHLLIVDPADIHINKLVLPTETGFSYDTETAINYVHEGVDGILNKVAHINIDKIVLVIGNDALNSDADGGRTTKGTPQDDDTRWHEAFRMARTMYVTLIEKLMLVADVHVIYNSSNHDFVSGFCLADSIASWFNKSKNVTFDKDIIHRKYFQYGENMICTSHGDGGKEKDIPILASTEEKQMWADTTYRYAYLHHVHHYKKVWVKAGEDSQGFTIEYLRSPSPPDRWHHTKGYTQNYRAVEAFVHSKERGQEMKITHYFK